MDRQALIEQCERAQRACDGMVTALEALQSTYAQTQALIAEARRIPALGPCIDTSLVPAVISPHTAALVIAIEPNEHELEMEVLRMMRTLMDGFPAHIKVKTGKALTARTILVVAAQPQTARITSTP